MEWPEGQKMTDDVGIMTLLILNSSLDESTVSRIHIIGSLHSYFIM